MSTSLIGKNLNKYRVVEKLGSGGMADVYKGIQIGLDREVAIKVLPPAFASDKEMVKRFKRESQATAKLSHPNIITIYDSGEQDGYYFYVMEYLKADSLEDVLEKEKPLAIARALKIGQDILKAMVYTHEKDIWHRDLKPANIKFDLRENAIVTDFGLVKDLGETAITRTGVALGTPQYMSPEQLKGVEVDARSDLYQIGVIMYEMLTGRTPIQVQPKQSISAAKLLGQKIPDPKEINAEIPDDLAAFLLKSVKEDVAERYQSAKDMLAELKKIELKQKAKKFSSSKQTMAVSRSVSMPSSAGSSTSAISASQVGSSTSAMNTSSLSASQSGGSAFGSSLSAILASPRDRESLIKLLMITVPVFLFGLVGVLWGFGLVFQKAEIKLLEQARDVESNKATISWKTAPGCFSQVEYWQATSTQNKQRTKRVPIQQAEHRHSLPDLKPDTTYNYRFLYSYYEAEDAEATASEVFDFTTRPEIQIFNIHVDEYATKAVVTWETNLRTDTTIKYGRTDQYEDTKTNTEQKSETIHSITLEGLIANTAYHYQIVASDPRGRGQPKTSEDLVFQTSKEGGDPTSDPNKESAGLVNLTKSYVDKLTRMTPDEREKLKSSIQKFTDPKQELSPAEKKTLVETKTNPTKEDEFNNRLQQLRCWLGSLKTKGKDVSKHANDPKLLQSLYYTNKVKASKKLDALLVECSKLDK
jgi:serine/threonine protein kinase